MAKDRIVSGAVQPPDEETAGGDLLRPQRLDDYVGQPDLVQKLRIALQAVRERGEAMEHVLLHGPPGLGKTTMARIIAHEMGTRLIQTGGPALTKPADLLGTLTSLEARDVLFVDEIHRLPKVVEEYIYPAMEDFKVDFTLDRGLNARAITYPLKPFTLLGATTRPGLLTGALRSRFGMQHYLQFYEPADLVLILRQAARMLGLRAEPEALSLIAERSRGTPRVALRLLKWVRNVAQVHGHGGIDRDSVEQALRIERVDEKGLDHHDRAYLRVLAETYRGGPAGVEAIAAHMSEDPGTLEDVIEPYLLQLGLLARTRQGRRLTEAGWLHLGVAPEQIPHEASLF